jgi:hypothetical protein
MLRRNGKSYSKKARWKSAAGVPPDNGWVALTRSFAYNGPMTQIIGLYCVQRAHVGQQMARRVLVNGGNLVEGDNNAS